MKPQGLEPSAKARRGRTKHGQASPDGLISDKSGDNLSGLRSSVSDSSRRIIYLTSHNPARYFRPRILCRVGSTSGIDVKTVYIELPRSRMHEKVSSQYFRNPEYRPPSYMRFLLSFVSIYRLGWRRICLFVLLMVRAASVMRRGKCCGIVVVNDNFDSVKLLSGWILARIFSCKFVVDVMDMVDSAYSGPIKFMVRRADLIMFFSKTQMDLAHKIFGLDPEKTCYVPLTLDRNHFADIGVTSGEARQMLGLSLDSKVVVYAGASWWIGKREVNGLTDLIRAMKSVVDVHPNAILVLAGLYADREPSLVHLVNELRLNDKVRFLGEWTRKFEHYCFLVAADLLVLPATSCLPVFTAARHKILYYMATGKPIVAVATPEIRSMTEDCKCIIAAKPDSSSSLAEAIVAALDNYEASRKLGIMAKKLFDETLCTEAMTPEILRTLDRICDVRDSMPTKTISEPIHDHSNVDSEVSRAST